jgi:hypothetical protein
MKNKSNGYGIASMVLGIMSILVSWIVFAGVGGVICGILAIIFSVKQRKSNPNGVATAGLVTGIIGLILSTLWTCLYLLTLISGAYS